MKNALRKLGHAARNRYTQAGVGLTVLAAAGSANATETTAAQNAIAALETEAQTMIDSAWPLATLIVGSTIGIKLFKKYANRAS